MAGIKALILRRNFTVVKKKVNSWESHLHFGNGSYLCIDTSIQNKVATIKSKPDCVPDPNPDKQVPTLLFQEGIATPLGKRGGIRKVAWETWYTPMMRGLHKRPHKRGGFGGLGKIFNLKTLPFWVIGLALAWHFLGPLVSPSVVENTAENAAHKIVENFVPPGL